MPAHVVGRALGFAPASRVKILARQLGASLARLEMRVVFEELLPAFERYELISPVEWTRSNRHTGIRHLVLSLSRG